MGDMVQASCPCGYESEMLFDGCGWNVDGCRQRARCEHCHDVVSVLSRAARKRCPSCRRAVVLLPNDDRDDSQRGDALRMDLECPRCHQPSMRLETTGLWD